MRAMNDMPKEMQEAYLKVKEQDVPDLWSRIEAGYLKEIEDMKAESEENKVVSIESARKKRRIPRGVLSTVAAAVLITVIAVPTYFNQKKSDDKNSDYSVGMMKTESTEMLSFVESDDVDAPGIAENTSLPEVDFEEVGAACNTEEGFQTGYLVYINTEDNLYVTFPSVTGDMASEVQPYEMILVNNEVDMTELEVNTNPDIEIQVKTPADYYGPLKLDVTNLIDDGENHSCNINILGTE